jgi:phosphoribosylaminoimidazole (AIR) synthetase
MKTITLPDPPNPQDTAYQRDPKSFNLATYRWMSNLKSQLQEQSRINDRPIAQAFTVSNFTTATTLTGTDTTTNVPQVLCTLIQAMISKGLLKSNIINQ